MVATTSWSNSQRIVSISWITESVIAMSLVNVSGTDALRWTMCASSGSPMLPSSMAALTHAVGAVVAAHEPHLDQPAPDGHLGLENLQGVLAGGGQRLLAQHRLAGVDAREHLLGVQRPRRGDHDGVDVRGVDQVGPGGVRDGAHRLGHLRRALGRHVEDRGDLRP